MAAGSGVGRSVFGAVCVGAFLMGFLALGPSLIRQGPQLLQLTATHATIGQDVDLRGQGSRPRLELAADRPVPARQAGKPAERVQAPPGTRLVAVHFRFRNAGKETWSTPSSDAYSLTDSTGGHPGRVLVKALRHGSQLRQGVRLRPGEVREGYVVYALPRGARITDIRMTVGPMPRETVEWTVD